MAMRMCGLTHLQHIWEPAKDSRVALAWSRTTVMLAFRGTASLKNAATDCAVRCPRWNTSLLLWEQAVYEGDRDIKAIAVCNGAFYVTTGTGEQLCCR